MNAHYLSSKKELKDRLMYTMIFIGITLIAIWGAYTGTHMNFLNASNSFVLNAQDFTPDYTARRIVESEVGLKQYSYELTKDEFDKIKDRSYKLIINKLTDNAIRVYFNGQMILSEGDFNNGNSMFKNAHVFATIDDTALKSNNSIVIETYSLYKTGIESSGVYITKEQTGQKVIQLLDLFYTKLVSVGLGFLLFSAIFTAFVYIISDRKDHALIFCSLASISLSLYFIDYLKIVDLPMNYIVFKKIFLLGLASGVLCYTLAAYSFIKEKFLLVNIGVFYGMYLAIMVFTDNMIQFKTWYEYWYFFLILEIFIFIFYFFKNARTSSRAFIFLITFVVLGIYSAYAVFIEFAGGYFVLNSPYLYMSILAVLPLLVGFDEFNNKEHQLHKEKLLKEEAFLDSLTDALTGAWNKRYFEVKISGLSDHITAVMIDLDHFKEVNDTYGHLAGDYLLQEITNIITQNIGPNDELCRYGGDEFIIIFNESSLKVIKETVTKIHQTISNEIFFYKHTPLSISLSIGIATKRRSENAVEFFERLDTLLYQSKKAGRNCIKMDSADETIIDSDNKS